MYARLDWIIITHEKLGVVCSYSVISRESSSSHIRIYKSGYVQARSLGGFERVRTNPPCSLAKLIFNEIAAVQGTIIQPCSVIVTDGIQAIMQLLQGVVTYTSPVEAFATGIKNFDR